MKKRIICGLMIAFMILISVNYTSFAEDFSPQALVLSDERNDPFKVFPFEGQIYISPPIIDQYQESATYGFMIGNTPSRWQEFIPTLDNISGVDIFINKTGSPGDLVVEIRDETGVTIIDQQTILENDVPALDWLYVNLSDQALTPGEIYRIYVYSAQEPITDNKYFWRGETESTYCRRCDSDISEMSVTKPYYDYAFRTYGVGVRRVTEADFDGDRSSDISVYRPSNGKWYIRGESAVAWGYPGDIPVPGEYLNSGHNDIAVYRPSNGNWYIKGMAPVSWGHPDDLPIPADYDGDGITEIAVLRSSNGKWYIRGMGNFSWYHSEDVPVPCDYDGDFADEIAVYRPSNGNWYIKGIGRFSWGFPEDIPVPGDYDGDGTCDIAVYRPSNGNWYIKGQGMTSWGHEGDLPVPGDYDGCGDTEIAVLRPSNGKWYIQGMGNFFWYYTGDYPLPDIIRTLWTW